jgi:hypothetical protein
MHKIFLLISALILVDIIYSCGKPEETQTFDYCDFKDVVLKYPDTSGIVKDTFYLKDSVLLNIECSPNTFFTIYSFVDRANGKPISPFTNKGMSANGNSWYSISFLDGSTCSFLPCKKDDEIINLTYRPPNNRPYSRWNDRNVLVSDSWPGCYKLDLGDTYLAVKKDINNETYMGWVHCNFTTDSAVFYECAFSHQPNRSILAGQH